MDRPEGRGRWGLRRVPFRGVALLLAALAALLAVGVARAQEPVPPVLLTVTEETQVGQVAEMVARVVDDRGAPVEGVPVTFLVDLAFMNVSDLAVVGRAVTDDQGVARLRWVPRSQGELTVVARVEDGATGEVFEATAVTQVLPGPPTFQPPEPVRIPGANVWLVVTVLAIVWTLYLWIAWSLIRIADVAQPQGREGLYE